MCHFLLTEICRRLSAITAAKKSSHLDLTLNCTSDRENRRVNYALSTSGDPSAEKNMLDKVQEINNEGSAYNLIGLVFKFSRKPNIMFCSQFTYTMLEIAGLNYFEQKAAHVRPTDFIELDYYRKLQFVDRIVLDNGDNAYGEENP